MVDTRTRPNKERERERERERTRKKAQEMCLATQKTRSGGIYVGIYVGIYSSKTRSGGIYVGIYSSKTCSGGIHVAYIVVRRAVPAHLLRGHIYSCMRTHI